MEAIEFVAKAEDGIIKVPKKYLRDLPKKFRIIILINEAEKPKNNKKKTIIRFESKNKRFTF